MLLIHKTDEGMPLRQGLNWQWDPYQIRLILRIGRLVLYYRRRRKYFFKDNPRKNIFDRFVLPEEDPFATQHKK